MIGNTLIIIGSAILLTIIIQSFIDKRVIRKTSDLKKYCVGDIPTDGVGFSSALSLDSCRGKFYISKNRPADELNAFSDIIIFNIDGELYNAYITHSDLKFISEGFSTEIPVNLICVGKVRWLFYFIIASFKYRKSIKEFHKNLTIKDIIE